MVFRASAQTEKRSRSEITNNFLPCKDHMLILKSMKTDFPKTKGDYERLIVES